MLAGYDSESLQGLYLDRPLKGATDADRVNRAFLAKADGLLGYCSIWLVTLFMNASTAQRLASSAGSLLRATSSLNRAGVRECSLSDLSGPPTGHFVRPLIWVYGRAVMDCRRLFGSD